MHCNAWGLAREVLQNSLESIGQNTEDLANLAWCEARTGNLYLGQTLVEKALALDSNNALAREVSQRISKRLGARDTDWMVELRHSSLPLVLEPLDESHADAYWRQYRDPQIAVMTGLPAMQNIQEVREWIQSQHGEKDRINFAVMHQDQGFVGFINLSVSERASFFCFWTGVDFQGAGLATAAGRLVCEYAATRGVPIMLTSAYKDNHRSIRALGRIGFTPLSIRAHPPDQDRLFFSLIDPSAGTVNSEIELVDYYARENLPLKFVGYESEADSYRSESHREPS
jgi:RimJ/RimL family protein N-acetyltransferase